MRLLRLFLVAVAVLTAVVQTGLVGPNRPAVERDFGLTHTQFGLGLAGVWVFTGVLTLLVSGRLRRLNPVAVVQGGMAVQVAGFAVVVLGAGGGVGWLALGWGLVLLGAGVRYVTNNISMDLRPANPRRGVLLLHSYNAGGKALGPLVVAAVFALGWTWRTSFLVVGAATLALLLVFLPAIPAARRFYANHPRRPRPDGQGFERGLLRDRRFWMFAAGIGLIAGGEAAFATLLPTFLVKVRGLSEATAATLFTVHLLGLMTGRFLAAGLGKRVPSNAIIAVCLTAGVFVAPALLLDVPAVRVVSLFLMGFQFSAVWPVFYTQAALHLPGHRDMLAYGANLGSAILMSGCVFVSSAIADANLTAAMFFGPCVLWGFGAMYAASRLSRPPEGQPAS